MPTNSADSNLRRNAIQADKHIISSDKVRHKHGPNFIQYRDISQATQALLSDRRDQAGWARQKLVMAYCFPPNRLKTTMAIMLTISGTMALNQSPGYGIHDSIMKFMDYLKGITAEFTHYQDQNNLSSEAVTLQLILAWLQTRHPERFTKQHVDQFYGIVCPLLESGDA